MRADQRLLPTEIVDEATRLFTLDQPSLKNLSYILRHKELWPEGFEWSYEKCPTCAMGLAAALWGVIDTKAVPVTPQMATYFDIPAKIADRVFGGKNIESVFGVYWYHQITPEMVADKIDEYLAGRE